MWPKTLPCVFFTIIFPFMRKRLIAKKVESHFNLDNWLQVYERSQLVPVISDDTF